MTDRRIIAIGDIHGCAAEFAELLKELELQPADQLILLGDLINRGPDSAGVIDLAIKHRALSLLGNHERRLIEYRKSKKEEWLRDGDWLTFQSLRDEHWAYLEAMPLTHFEPELNVIFVHGGFLPNIPWQKQNAEIVTRIQVVDSTGRACKRADAPGAPTWADLWNGPPFVVYGHTPRDSVYKLKWSLCLDTACAMGGALTAYVLPERRLVQVKARRRYWNS